MLNHIRNGLLIGGTFNTFKKCFENIKKENLVADWNWVFWD